MVLASTNTTYISLPRLQLAYTSLMSAPTGAPWTQRLIVVSSLPISPNLVPCVVCLPIQHLHAPSTPNPLNHVSPTGLLLPPSWHPLPQVLLIPKPAPLVPIFSPTPVEWTKEDAPSCTKAYAPLATTLMTQTARCPNVVTSTSALSAMVEVAITLLWDLLLVAKAAFSWIFDNHRPVLTLTTLPLRPPQFRLAHHSSRSCFSPPSPWTFLAVLSFACGFTFLPTGMASPSFTKTTWPTPSTSSYTLTLLLLPVLGVSVTGDGSPQSGPWFTFQ